MSVAVEFDQVSRLYGAVKAVDNVSLSIPDGEFFSLLGPSGSGKTTCLRLIAGFEQPSEGVIKIHGVQASGLPPYLRDVNTVFQDYALFPHMNVLENIEYGLMVKGVNKPDRRRRASEALALVALDGMGQRRPAQLSGGQRQRIALARAVVNRPKVLLLDEPLGALDLKLREQMQAELKSIQKKLGITFVFVTHDQGEALSMSDRVAVFNKGRIEQVGNPVTLYNRPETVFVANFVGSSNVFDALSALRLTGISQAFSIRPENIAINQALADAVTINGNVLDIQYHGATSRVEIITADGLELSTVLSNSLLQAHGMPAPGDSVQLSWPASAMVPLRD
jgi:putative spermidine/putrescine transport system ATP-binding protein